MMPVTYSDDLDVKILAAIAAVNRLSNDAEVAGDSGVMYAANRAWRELIDARNQRAERASPPPS